MIFDYPDKSSAINMQCCKMKEAENMLLVTTLLQVMNYKNSNRKADQINKNRIA